MWRRRKKAKRKNTFYFPQWKLTRICHELVIKQRFAVSAKHKLCVFLHPSFLTKGTSVPCSRKDQIQLSRSCGAETSLQQSTLDSYSNYNYLELPGTNYVHFPTNLCLFYYAPLPSFSICPQTFSFPSSHKT